MPNLKLFRTPCLSLIGLFSGIFRLLMKPQKPLLVLAALFAGSSVAIGAFAAHALKAVLTQQALGWMDTAVQYQQFHSLALLGVVLLWIRQPGLNHLKYSAWCFVVGMVLFCGSLYLMAATDVRALGMVTPLGGLAFLLGWIVFAVTVWRTNTRT